MPGGEIEILGSGFAASPAGNRVTVETNSRGQAEVTSATSDRLTVQLPETTVSGSLLVERGGAASNAYHLDIPFSPRIDLKWVDWESPAGGVATATSHRALQLQLSQSPDEISPYQIEWTTSNGSWVTDGFSVDEVIGTFSQESRFVDRETIFLQSEGQIIVTSSSPQALEMEARLSGDDDPAWLLGVTPQGGMKLELPELDLTGYVFLDLIHLFAFSQAILELPAGGADLETALVLISLPQRTAKEETVIRINRQQSVGAP